MTAEERADNRLASLSAITSSIQNICKLDFFSTELVLTPDEKIVAVDYVNEMCDMRFQSRHEDGVPDSLVKTIVQRLFTFIENSAFKLL